VGSGEGLLAPTGRWTERKKHAIMESRRRGTQLLAQALASVRAKPRVLVSASGVGFYGSRGDELLEEGASQGRGFLADVAGVWEANTAPAAAAGVRVVNARFGVILSATGGALGACVRAQLLTRVPGVRTRAPKMEGGDDPCARRLLPPAHPPARAAQASCTGPSSFAAAAPSAAARNGCRG